MKNATRYQQELSSAVSVFFFFPGCLSDPFFFFFRNGYYLQGNVVVHVHMNAELADLGLALAQSFSHMGEKYAEAEWGMTAYLCLWLGLSILTIIVFMCADRLWLILFIVREALQGNI